MLIADSLNSLWSYSTRQLATQCWKWARIIIYPGIPVLSFNKQTCCSSLRNYSQKYSTEVRLIVYITFSLSLTHILGITLFAAQSGPCRPLVCSPCPKLYTRMVSVTNTQIAHFRTWFQDLTHRSQACYHCNPNTYSAGMLGSDGTVLFMLACVCAGDWGEETRERSSTSSSQACQETQTSFACQA